MTTQQEGLRSKNGEQDEKLTYRCGYCGTQYDNELLLRAHITRSDDEKHKNHSGNMPEDQIEVLNSDGEMIGEVNEARERQEFKSLTLDDMPDDLKETHRRIVLAAAQNPFESSYKRVEVEVEPILERDGYDKPTYSTIRRVIRKFFRPHEEEDTETGATGTAKEESADADAEPTVEFADLTPKRQALIMEMIANPDATKKQWAENTQTANSYPKQVQEDYGDLIDELKAEHEESDRSVAEIIASRLDEAAVEKFKEYVDDEDPELTVDLDVVLGGSEAYDMGVDEQQKAMSASPFEDEESEQEVASATIGDETWGGTESTTSSPETAETSDEDHLDSPSEITLEQQEPTPEDEAEAVIEVEETTTQEEQSTSPETTNGETVPREEVESLLENVEFAMRMETIETGRGAVLDTVAEDLEEILSKG